MKNSILAISATIAAFVSLIAPANANPVSLVDCGDDPNHYSRLEYGRNPDSQAQYDQIALERGICLMLATGQIQGGQHRTYNSVRAWGQVQVPRGYVAHIRSVPGGGGDLILQSSTGATVYALQVRLPISGEQYTWVQVFAPGNEVNDGESRIGWMRADLIQYNNVIRGRFNLR
ncbi:MAG: hypothetical protein MJA27_35265 [Pseudanabaenales cyanobacterium]|nr:hypothetical protein [Pseudanabaenales cyanobacterium]